jgi:hypothetical protein
MQATPPGPKGHLPRKRGRIQVALTSQRILPCEAGEVARRVGGGGARLPVALFGIPTSFTNPLWRAGRSATPAADAAGARGAQSHEEALHA